MTLLTERFVDELIDYYPLLKADDPLMQEVRKVLMQRIRENQLASPEQSPQRHEVDE